MKKLVFLSCDSLENVVGDDDLLVKELCGNFEITSRSWTHDENWSNYDAVIVRTTWDYMQRPMEFLDTLTKIQLSGVKLFNPFSVISWNIHKFYLQELEAGGIFIVPTLFIKSEDIISIPDEWKAEKFVLKPAISAGAYQTKVVTRKEIERTKLKGEWLLQPFVESIAQGEISLIYFDKKFSHALIKIPKSGEFRVQEEFGGNVLPYSPDDKILGLADEILSKVDLPLLYARVDLVALDGSYALMELELIEPALYFRTHKQAASNFHLALINYL
ncbi:MAG TPA: hypothetical protein VNJ08_01720 [Bacteriovoracaceae bacterium]|nr:hypothetical protein [Bacteriovoracaceae bacterium]